MSNAKYFPSTHAVDQLNVRFGVAKPQAHAWLATEMRKATYIQTQGDGRMVYETADARIIVSGDAATTISVTPLATALPVHDKVRTIVQRQLRLATARHRRDTRVLAISMARLDVTIAQLRLNQQLAKSPVAKAQIERKISLVNADIAQVALEMKRADEVLDTERRASKMYGVVSV